jgi:replicative DNA helicase
MFGKLMINDQALTFHQMDMALREAEQQWGAKCEGVIVDYLDLLPGDADYNGTKGKSVHLKRWTKEQSVPVVCIHQPKRGGAARGTRIGMDDMNQGGETEATFVLGVYRKRDDYELPTYERDSHLNTITVRVDKNKRPPCHVGEYDYYLDPHSGRMRDVRPDDGVEPGMPMTATVARAVRERARPESTVATIQRALTGVA